MIVPESFEPSRGGLHREVWELLPWLANGSLDDVQRRRCEQHLTECRDCREELRVQQILRQEIQSEESVLHTPHASLRKLMTRIDHDEVGAAPRESAPARRRQRWLAAAVVIQAVALIGLAGFMSWRLHELREAPRYATLASSSTQPATSGAARIVFTASTSVAELSELLRAHRAEIVAGPSEAGVYTVVLNQGEAAEAVARLRENPMVRFIERTDADEPK